MRIRLSLDETRGSYVGIDEAVAGQPTEPTAPERRGTFMFYSSGTTGRPKGIKPPLPDTPAAAGDPIGIGFSRFSVGPDPIYLSPAPLHHAAPLRTSMGVMEAGATVICLERFDPESALAAIEAHRVTSSQWVPTMFIRMLKLDPAVRTRYDLSSLRTAVHAAAPCPVWAKEQMIEWWGPIIDEYYAGSENIGSTWITSEEWLAHRGSVGKSAFGGVHICDPDGNELPIGEDGLVYFDATPGSEFEYHDAPEKTAGVWHHSQPWRTLGDIGHVDEEQYLYLSDRASFMIISGGANVYPAGDRASARGASWRGRRRRRRHPGRGSGRGGTGHRATDRASRPRQLVARAARHLQRKAGALQSPGPLRATGPRFPAARTASCERSRCVTSTGRIPPSRIRM